ncbi:MAG TPA: hypothetical protein VHE83_18425 [Mycobacteriales bacterium]|nr:hypothetical protein [Mycobacteriales bacterium]
MDARDLALALDGAATQLATIAVDLAEAGARLGTAAVRAAWSGRAAEAALDVLVADIAAVLACAAAADRASRTIRVDAGEAAAIEAVAARW